MLDTPAGLYGKKLHDVLGLVDRVIVPLRPSLFDILATRDFLAALREAKEMRDGIEVGIVGMRVDPRTRAAGELHRFFDSVKLSVIGYLRDTQVYVQVAAHGLTLFDLAPSRAENDLEQWQSLLPWVDGRQDNGVGRKSAQRAFRRMRCTTCGGRRCAFPPYEL